MHYTLCLRLDFFFQIHFLEEHMRRHGVERSLMFSLEISLPCLLIARCSRCVTRKSARSIPLQA
jgi:hypothetical protein